EKQNRTVTNDLAPQGLSPEHYLTRVAQMVVNTIFNTSNLNETCFGKSKLLEDKEIDVFLDSENKKRVSDEIRQRNMEKKLLHSNEASASRDASTGSEKTITSLYDTKTVTKCHDLNNSDITSEILESYNQIVEGLIQEMTYDQAKNIVSSEINPLYLNNDKYMAPDSVQSLSDLFDKAIKSGQKQILNWYYYSLEFENNIKSLTADGQIKDKTARSKIYKEMKPFLPNITDANLRKKTERARKILKLFGDRGVGIDKIEYITYSASTISGLKNTQIQHIINEVTSKTVTNCHDQINVELNVSVTSSRQPIPRTNPNKMECLYQYAIEHGMDPDKFSVITEAEKNRWAMGCFREDLERDIRFYRGGIKSKEDPRKYRKFLTDRERLVGEELLRRSILKSGLSTAWLDNLMKEWEEIYTQFIQIFSQT
ncbi:10665_t:CDS:2, partial [Paraglomus brasilianum]